MSTFEVLGFLASVVFGVVAGGTALLVFILGYISDDVTLRRVALIPAACSALLFCWALWRYDINVVLAR